MNKELIIEKAKEMMSAASCCQEAKDACRAYIDAAGTDGEAEALKNLEAELKEDVCSIDGLIGLCKSPMGVKIFGEERSASMLKAAEDAKAAGGRYCICPACQAGGAILDEIG